MKKKTNHQLCAEYNEITGENVKRFASIAHGKEMMRLAKKGKVKPKPFPVRVDSNNFPSVRQAFVRIGLPINQYRGVMNKLKVCKSTQFMGYKFKRR